MNLVIGIMRKTITEVYVMRNQDQFDQEMRRFGKYVLAKSLGRAAQSLNYLLV